MRHTLQVAASRGSGGGAVENDPEEVRVRHEVARAIFSKLCRLKEVDRQRALSTYELGETVSASTVERIEREFGVELPADYRSFITEVGDGLAPGHRGFAGAGPGYGLLPFGVGAEDEGIQARDLSRDFPATDAWNVERPEVLHEAHVRWWDELLAWSWSQADERKGLTPLAEALSSDARAEFTARFGEDPATEYRELLQDSGTLPMGIADSGRLTILIVRGPSAGQVWIDGREHFEGFWPEMEVGEGRVSFGQWYSAWLDRSLEDFANLEELVQSGTSYADLVAGDRSDDYRVDKMIASLIDFDWRKERRDALLAIADKEREHLLGQRESAERNERLEENRLFRKSVLEGRMAYAAPSPEVVERRLASWRRRKS